MNDIDELIKQALCEDDAKWFDELDEQAMHEMVIDSFRGKLRWFVVLVYISVVLFTVLLAVCAWQLFRTEDVHAAMAWGFGLLFSALAVAMLKIWYWMELNKNAMIREMKRMELQLARLSARGENH